MWAGLEPEVRDDSVPFFLWRRPVENADAQRFACDFDASESSREMLERLAEESKHEDLPIDCGSAFDSLPDGLQERLELRVCADRRIP